MMYRLAIWAAISWAAYGQLPGTLSPPAAQTTPAKPVETDPFGRETPRGCVLGFLKAVERGDYSQAAQYLDVGADSQQAQELARQLQTLLNRGLIGNLDNLSRAPNGDLKEDLPADRNRVGYVETSSGRLDILLSRVQRDTGPPIWLFSFDTLSGVPRAFDEVNTPGFEKFIPQPLKAIKIFSLPLWRWMAIILSIAIALLSASLLTRALIPLLRPLVRRIAGHADDRYLLSLRRPISLVLMALAVRIMAQFSLSLLAHAFWKDISNVLVVAGFSWLLIEFSDIVSDLRSYQLVRRQITGQLAVLSLAHRLFKILVLFVALVLLLHEAGVNVSAMLAGLGIGGIALALAAQKTLEDLFGGITIIVRQAIRVGDFCQLADQMGTIEDIGLGSTRVRTLGNTVVTIPNARVSQMSLENYSMRKKIWFHQIFGLRSDTSAEQMRQVLSEINQLLREDKRVEKESARIRLIEFGASSLKVEIFAYIKVTDYSTFLEAQEALMLRVMDIIAASGTSIALPAQMTYLKQDGLSGGYDAHAVPEDSRKFT